MIRVYPDAATLAVAAAAHVESCLFDAIRRGGLFRLFLAGGRTPEACYRILAEGETLPPWVWKHTEIFFGDERCVPADDLRSNLTMARRSLLDAVTPAVVHAMDGSLDPEEGARRYAPLLPAVPDLILLGMGEDGHTASLFPGTEALRAETLVAPGLAPEEPRHRLTITPSYLRRARALAVLVSGEGKARALQAVFAPEGSIEATPARLLRHGEWFLDRAAAERILRELPMRVRGVDPHGAVLFEAA